MITKKQKQAIVDFIGDRKLSEIDGHASLHVGLVLGMLRGDVAEFNATIWMAIRSVLVAVQGQRDVVIEYVNMIDEITLHLIGDVDHD